MELDGKSSAGGTGLLQKWTVQIPASLALGRCMLGKNAVNCE